MRVVIVSVIDKHTGKFLEKFNLFINGDINDIDNLIKVLNSIKKSLIPIIESRTDFPNAKDVKLKINFQRE